MSKLKDFRVWLATKILGSIGLVYNIHLTNDLEFTISEENNYILDVEIKGDKVERAVMVNLPPRLKRVK